MDGGIVALWFALPSAPRIALHVVLILSPLEANLSIDNLEIEVTSGLVEDLEAFRGMVEGLGLVVGRCCSRCRFLFFPSGVSLMMCVSSVLSWLVS